MQGLLSANTTLSNIGRLPSPRTTRTPSSARYHFTYPTVYCDTLTLSLVEYMWIKMADYSGRAMSIKVYTNGNSQLSGSLTVGAVILVTAIHLRTVGQRKAPLFSQLMSPLRLLTFSTCCCSCLAPHAITRHTNTPTTVYQISPRTQIRARIPQLSRRPGVLPGPRQPLYFMLHIT